MDVDQPTANDKQNAVDQVTEGQLRFTAMSLLARREHSQFELAEKLKRRFPNSSLIHEVVQQLADEALQSDSRFADAFVAMRVRKGQGPVRIEKELEQRRVAPQTIARALHPYQNQWSQLARTAWQKKYGGKPKPSPNERAKQVRFLLYRGFTTDQVQSLWRDE